MENPECGADPWNTEFEIPEFMNLDMNDPVVSRQACEAKNPGDECAILACQVEMAFIDYVIQAVFIHVNLGTVTPINQALIHPAFDTSENCPQYDAAGHPWANNIGTPAQYQCCGVHPQREVYNIAFKQCSADGSTLSDIGS